MRHFNLCLARLVSDFPNALNRTLHKPFEAFRFDTQARHDPFGCRWTMKNAVPKEADCSPISIETHYVIEPTRLGIIAKNAKIICGLQCAKYRV